MRGIQAARIGQVVFHAKLLSIDDRDVLSSSKVWYFPMRFFGAKDPDGYCPTAFRFVNAGCNRATFEAVPQQHVSMLTPPVAKILVVFLVFFRANLIPNRVPADQRQRTFQALPVKALFT